MAESSDGGTPDTSTTKQDRSLAGESRPVLPLSNDGGTVDTTTVKDGKGLGEE